jgi:hypothetical protein
VRNAREQVSTDRSEHDKRELPTRAARGVENPTPQPLGFAPEALGNRALLALIRSGQLQRKRRVGHSVDPLEHDADRAATAVVTDVHPEPARRGLADLPEFQQAAKFVSQSHGSTPLDEHTRELMESRFGESFADVRIHTGHHADETAEAVHSRAFTVGEDVVFAEGEFAPETTEGRRLLAHELAHVVQQRRPNGFASDERETERDAADASAELSTGGTPTVREHAARGSVQRALTSVPTDASAPLTVGDTFDWTISADGRDVVVAFAVPIGESPKPRAWENTDTKVVYVDPGTIAGSSGVLARSKWSARFNQVIISRGAPILEPPAPKPPAPAPTPKPKAAPPPKQTKPPTEAPPGEVPELVITADEARAEVVAAQPAPAPLPIGEQVLAALQANPAEAARLAPMLTNAELEQFTATDRVQLLGALASAGGALDIDTVVRIIQTTQQRQERDVLEGLVAGDGKVLAALRASVSPADSPKLEGALFILQLGVSLRNGVLAGPDLFDPLGARGFRKPVWMAGTPEWARDLRFRFEPNGDTTVQAPGQSPVVVEGLLTRTLRAQALNEQIASFEARQLSPQGKVNRVRDLANNFYTGSGDEQRIIDILHYTTADEAKYVLDGLKSSSPGQTPLIDKLDSVVDLDNNVLLHAELAALRMRARKDDPKLLTDLAKAPVLPWRDAFFHNRAVFNVQTLPDGRIAVTYGALQTFDLASSEAFGASMKALPKEMQLGGSMILQPDDIVIVNDTDANREVPLTAEDLVAFQHSGNRGMLKHMGTVASVVVPGGLAIRGTIGVGRAALEIGGAVLLMTAEEYRMELTKWSPGLMGAIDIANVALALKGGVDLARLGPAGVNAVFSRLKREYDLFKAARAAKMAASGVPNAIRAAQIADAEAQALIRQLEQISSGGTPGPSTTTPGTWETVVPGATPYQPYDLPVRVRIGDPVIPSPLPESNIGVPALPKGVSYGEAAEAAALRLHHPDADLLPPKSGAYDARQGGKSTFYVTTARKDGKPILVLNEVSEGAHAISIKTLVASEATPELVKQNVNVALNKAYFKEQNPLLQRMPARTPSPVSGTTDTYRRVYVNNPSEITIIIQVPGEVTKELEAAAQQALASNTAREGLPPVRVIVQTEQK